MRKLLWLAAALIAMPALAQQPTYTPDQATLAVTLGALNSAATIRLEGRAGASVVITTANLDGTVVPEVSADCTNWATARFLSPAGVPSSSIVFSGGAATETNTIIAEGGMCGARARVSVYNSGTSVGHIRATYVSGVHFATQPVSGASGGTQYTEGDIDASITGTALLFEGAANTLVAAPGTAADGLLVNLGANNDVIVSDGAGALNVIVDSATLGTVTVSDGAGAMNVIVDSATLGTVTVSDGAGAMNTIVDSGTLTAVTSITNSVTVTDGAGALNTIIDSGSVTVSDGAGALNVIVDSSALPSGAATSANQDGIIRDGAGDTTQANVTTGRLSVDGSGVTQPVSAASLPLPTGASTSALQDGIVKDGTGDTTEANVTTGRLSVDGSGVTQPVSGSVTVTQATATNLNAAVVGTGTAGTPAGNVLTVQGVASMTKLLVTPDSVALPANQSVNVAQVAGTNTVTGGVAGIIAVGGNVANAVAATANPVPVGGIFTTTPATLTSGQTATMQFTAAQNQKTDITTVAGTAPTTAGKLDVKAADGDVFVRQATATNLNAAVVGTGTAGTPAGNILTVQGVASMTKLLVTPDSVALPANQSVNQAQRGAVAVVAGACERETVLYIQISQTANTQLITGTASERIYICGIQLMTATAQNVALVDGTGSTCATSPTGLLGGSTAATGWNFAANGGIVLPLTRDSWTKTSTDADNVCLLNSGSGQISGSLAYISIPNI